MTQDNTPRVTQADREVRRVKAAFDTVKWGLGLNPPAPATEAATRVVCPDAVAHPENNFKTQEQTMELARFNHHPDPATDFCVEVEELLAIATSAKMGLTGMGHEEDREGYAARYRKAMEFVVGGDQDAIRAKAMLRDLPENVL